MSLLGIPTLMTLFVLADTPLPGQEIYWIAGLMATVAIPALFVALIKAKDQLATDWKGIAEKAVAELAKTIDALRSITDAVERRGNDTAGTLERHNQIILSMATEMHKIAESQV